MRVRAVPAKRSPTKEVSVRVREQEDHSRTREGPSPRVRRLSRTSSQLYGILGSFLRALAGDSLEEHPRLQSDASMCIGLNVTWRPSQMSWNE